MTNPKWKKISQFKGPEESPGFLLWQVSTKWRRQIETTLAALDLTHVQFVLLASIGWLTRGDNRITQVELACHCQTDINMTSQVLRTLEKKGYIERRMLEGNERSKFPFLTKQGANLVEKAIPLVERADHEFFKHIKKDSNKCMEIFKKLLEKPL